jgi:hypothetical protein
MNRFCFITVKEGIELMNSPEFNHFNSLEANSFDALFACSRQEWRQNLELDGKDGADQSTGAGLYGARRVAPET